MFVTDITNCYGAMNPQTIDWALSCKNTEHKNDANHEIAGKIISYLKILQQGQNIGIPQGNAIFDFVAEIILGYSDLLLYNALKEKDMVDDYQILRYRDDYRIFCNDKDKLEMISYILQSVLESLNLRLNSQKTTISERLITDSIKSDKLFYIKNTPIFNKKGVDFDGIQKHLLYILMFGREYPNGGQIKVMLTDLDKRIIKKLKPQKNTRTIIMSGTIDDDDNIFKRCDTYEEKVVDGKLVENIRAMVAVATQIAIENVGVTHYALRIVSRMVNSMDDNDDKWDIINKVRNKLINRPNSTYNQIWLQNITYHQDKMNSANPYKNLLCQLAMGEKISIWNNSWINEKFTKELPISSICDSDKLNEVTPVITFRETRDYYDL